MTEKQEGVSYENLQNDRKLGRKRHELVLAAALSLVEAKMINFDEERGSFTINDLGRLAAKYYIHHKSIGIFNRELRTRMTEADVLSMVCLSTEVSDSDQSLGNDLRNDHSLIKSKFERTRRRSLRNFLKWLHAL
jgi:replicative superfamily II helicase